MDVGSDELGLPLYLAPLVLVAMNLVYSAGAYPSGVLSDRVAPSRLLTLSLAALIATDICLALSDSVIGVFSGIALWGAHMALNQGLLSKLIADRAPPHLRASAFGLFNLCSRLSLLGASLLAGLLWTTFGAATTFLTGGGTVARRSDDSLFLEISGASRLMAGGLRPPLQSIFIAVSHVHAYLESTLHRQRKDVSTGNP